MSIKFRIVEHSLRPGVEVVEVVSDDLVIAMIYPDSQEPQGIKIVSAHIETEGVTYNERPQEWPPIPDVGIKFNPRPYVIKGDKLVREEGD